VEFKNLTGAERSCYRNLTVGSSYAANTWLGNLGKPGVATPRTACPTGTTAGDGGGKGRVPVNQIVVRNGPNLYSSTGSGWTLISSSATPGFWNLTGNRVVNQDANGLWVKDGASGWVRWGNGDSHEIQASSSRVVVRNGTNLYESTGSGWTLISNSATPGFWKLTGDRIFNQDVDGLWVKDGAGVWVRWGNGDSHEVQASTTRIVVRNGSNLYSSTGSGWSHISSTASPGFWKLTGDRVVNQDVNGLWVQDGAGGWVRWGNGDSHEIQASSARVVVRNSSNLYASTGSGWTLISNSATPGFWKLTGDRVINQDANGLWVKDGTGDWVRLGNGDSHEIQAS